MTITHGSAGFPTGCVVVTGGVAVWTMDAYLILVFRLREAGCG
jgi:hypothetical protein